MNKEKVQEAFDKALSKWHDEQGRINRQQLWKKAQELDAELLRALREPPILQKIFFREQEGITLFLADMFYTYLYLKNYLADDYTTYDNLLGLGDSRSRKLLVKYEEVVLNFPYKDCLLEGGQTKDEKKARRERFWNELLAPEEVNRLLAPKVLTNFVRHTPAGEKGVEDIDPLKENWLIKGNNLLVLHTLRERFAKQVKLIYIDPPYNTGNDSFTYNDRFTHGTWLVFMRDRLRIAHDFLRDDGVIFVQCDDNEQAYLKVLMDEIFGRENFVNDIIWVSNLKGRQISNKGATKTYEHILVYEKNDGCTKEWMIDVDVATTSMPGMYKMSDPKVLIDAKGDYVIKNELHNTNSKFNEETRRTLVFNIHYNPSNGGVKISPVGDSIRYDGYALISPKKNNNGTHKYHAWRWSGGKILRETDELHFKKNGENWKVYTKLRNFSKTRFKDIIMGKRSHESTINFDHPKPESLLWHIIAIATQPGDIVLDFCAGSGTTAAVAHKMGRHWIAVEQMDYIKPITCERLKKVLAGEQGGISKDVGWKGGGRFIYCELLAHNEHWRSAIEQANTIDELKRLWDEMKEKADLDYRLTSEHYDKIENYLQEGALEEAQGCLIVCLDVNMLYVPRSEIDDEDYKISDNDKKLNRAFTKISDNDKKLNRAFTGK